jgi:hypothetical protein
MRSYEGDVVDTIVRGRRSGCDRTTVRCTSTCSIVLTTTKVVSSILAHGDV